ncbi:hypothetical protein DKT68_02755 [Micromonospora acroterricola]|uniref:Uncharacterized protein n=1 Tax=Micromonospora acroterricola TaxID=2202421 RepID=A0A317DED4_9ACTN|nr:hypothetical protein [Micromonospora acroterricola]PWR12662.1 hypothetical protein DKT68_02755 [Micromonospora acroterricola]
MLSFVSVVLGIFERTQITVSCPVDAGPTPAVLDVPVEDNALREWPEYDRFPASGRLAAQVRCPA